MVIEMLLNSDIQKKIYSNDFTFSNRNTCNYIHYLEEGKLNVNHFIWKKYQ
jgi:hypothetical protein